MDVELTEADEVAIADREAGYLCERFLNTDLTPKQADIARAIAFPDEPQRIAITAVTQWGKSHGVAAGLGLGQLLQDGEPRFSIVAPRDRQARIIRDHFANRVVDSPLLQSLLEVPTHGAERLRREANKKRLTFTGGGELEVFSAEGDAERLMGHGGYDLVVEDEAGLIPDEVERKRISRMASKPGARRVKIGNPWAKGTHFHRACLTWDQVFTVGWEVAVDEGRMTRAFVDEQRATLSPLEWQVLYEARFPDTAEDALFPWEWVARAVVEGDFEPDDEAKPAGGLDVAEAGRDLNVHTQGWVAPRGGTVVADSWSHWHQADTMVSVARVERGTRGGVLAIDANGLGKPIYDRLRQRGHQVLDLKSGRRAIDSERFVNQGSEVLWHLRTMLEERRLFLINPPKQLLTDLTLYEMEMKTGRRRCFVDKTNYSPDHADSLAMFTWAAKRSQMSPAPIPMPTKHRLP